MACKVAFDDIVAVFTKGFQMRLPVFWENAYDACENLGSVPDQEIHEYGSKHNSEKHMGETGCEIEDGSKRCREESGDIREFQVAFLNLVEELFSVDWWTPWIDEGFDLT